MFRIIALAGPIISPSPRRVLVVEDDDDLRKAMILVLEQAGWCATGACNGEDALQRLARGPLPHAIVLDLVLPVLDGSALRWRLLANAAWARIPTLVCSGDYPAVESRGLPAIALWLKKPLSAGALAEAASLAVNRHTRSRAEYSAAVSRLEHRPDC